GMGVTLWVISIAIFCLGSLLGALNFITTLLNMRTRGMSLMRMPLTCWAWFTTAVLALLSFPVLLGGGILLLLDRLAGTSFFIPGNEYVSGILAGSDPRLPYHAGGSPLLCQHLVSFFGHSADALRRRACVPLRRRRHDRTAVGANVARLFLPRYLLRDGALSPGHGRGLHLWNVRGHFLLVSENVRPHAE